jgi:hypothetical protein
MIGPEDLLNAGEVVEVDGQAWTFSHITPVIRGQFSAWLKSRARQGLAEERREGILGPEEWREQSSLLNSDFAAGAYSWGSPLSPDGMGSAVQAALEEVDGKIRLVQLLLERDHGKVPSEKVLELMAASARMQQEAAKNAPPGQDVPNPIAEAIRACLDPNRQRPAMTPGEMKTVERVRGFRTGTATPS